MKNLLLLLTVALLFSCGGGWSSEEKAEYMDECTEWGEKDMCECLLDAAMDKWSSQGAMEEERIKYENMDREERREFRKEMEKWEDEVEEKCGG